MCWGDSAFDVRSRAGLATYSEKAHLVVVQLLHLRRKLPIFCDVDVYVVDERSRKLVIRHLVATLHHLIPLLPTSLNQFRHHRPCHQCPHFCPVKVAYCLELFLHHLPMTLVLEMEVDHSKLVTTISGYVSMNVRVWCVYVFTTVCMRTNDMCKCVCVCHVHQSIPDDFALTFEMG